MKPQKRVKGWDDFCFFEEMLQKSAERQFDHQDAEINLISLD
jgi:hypothetical protein